MQDPPATWKQAISRNDTPMSWWESWRGDPNDETDGGPTPLLFASWDGNASLMRLLLERGGNPKHTYQGKNWIQMALESQDPEAILFSISRSQDLDSPLGSGKNIPAITRSLGVHDFFLDALGRERQRRAELTAQAMEMALPESVTDRGRERL